MSDKDNAVIRDLILGDLEGRVITLRSWGVPRARQVVARTVKEWAETAPPKVKRRRSTAAKSVAAKPTKKRGRK